ncbi:conserved hypothetical membrane protein [Formosa agariphila KMM 3901]|uniref:Conserved hypothetical membrane protein n=1 Tax=Formosa agariphila (strain DSM 15362 / KCTC 12365 / LMG 23005 / KMM 3901 / M-2Alg 35-1) TaxID=1347342 RepID=T2KH83_FORAG|nr:hypothetical protein [Formosa agariphila]CDF77758.1 conserved hypothetical membrane protein [Formosa agariphila KMM 3901]
MNIQILPNWCKKLGALAFIVFTFISAAYYTVDCNEYCINTPQIESSQDNHPNTTQSETKPESLDHSENNLSHLFSILSYVGLFIYMLSREKVEDDYINKLRLESYQLTIILLLIISIITYAFFKELRMSFDYFLETFMILYLIIFFFKKRIYV